MSVIPPNPIPSQETPAPVMLQIPQGGPAPAPAPAPMISLQPGSNVMVPQQPMMAPQGYPQGQPMMMPQGQPMMMAQPQGGTIQPIQPVNALHPFAASAAGNTAQKYQPTPAAQDNGHIYINGYFKVVGWSEKSAAVVWEPSVATYANLVPTYTGIPTKNLSKNINKLPDGSGAREGYWFPRSQLQEMSAKISAFNQKIESGELNNPEAIGSMVLAGAQAPAARTIAPMAAPGGVGLAFAGALPNVAPITPAAYPNHFVTDKGIEYRAILTTVPVPVVGKKVNITYVGTEGTFEYNIISVNGLSFTLEGYGSKPEVKLVNLEYQILNQSAEHRIEFM